MGWTGGGGGGGAAAEAQQTAEDNRAEDLAFQLFLMDQATAKEDARLGGIKKNLGLVNSLFGGLSFDEFGNAVYGLNKENIQDQRTEGNRELGFRLARAGLSGGSVEADKEAAMDKRYTESIGEARNYADNLTAQLQGQAQGLQGQYSSLASTGAPISGSSIVNAIGGLQSTAPQLNPATQDAFTGIYENIGNYLAGLGTLGSNPLASTNEFSSFKPSSPRKNYQGQIQT